MNSEQRAKQQKSGEFDGRDVRTTLTRELWTSSDRSAQFQARVGVFGGNLVRVGISRFWWSVDEKRFIPSSKGHCYFPFEALEGLAKVLPELQTEAKRLLAANGGEQPHKKYDGRMYSVAARSCFTLNCTESYGTPCTCRQATCWTWRCWGFLSTTS
jgi:hypothetical protein